MYLKSLQIKNYRKFGDEDNTIYFVAGDKTAQDTIEVHSKVAAATTLIVGKNNAGKTTAINALRLLLDSSDVRSNDINFRYLRCLFDGYAELFLEDKTLPIVMYPELNFSLSIGVEDELATTLISNLSQLIDINFVSDFDCREIKLSERFEIQEAAVFRDAVIKILEKAEQKGAGSPYDPFKKFLQLVDETKFRKSFFRSNGEVVDKSFKLSELIDLKCISANKQLDGPGLSSMFNKMIKRKYDPKNNNSSFSDISDALDQLNHDLTSKIDSNKTDVNGVLSKIESTSHLEVELSSDVNLDKLLTNLIKYEYNEQGTLIPETQFGLGYTNLMHIIGHIIDYVEQYPDNKMQTKINLICIEEPEAFMHPQMQENFIKYIDDAVSFLLGSVTKKINSQLVITTHSSHVLHSKIHSANSFDNINYMSTRDHHPVLVQLNDKIVSTTKVVVSENGPGEELAFLKKHIKYKASELFFADAAILVEGATEEILLKYYLEQHHELSKHHIVIFQIDGAHGSVYHPLIKLLQIPTVIITDFDLKRREEEKGKGKPQKYCQINDLAGRETTNATIQHFNKSVMVEDIKEYFLEDNIYCVFQKDAIQNFFATSFEEAFILTNYDSEFLKKALKKVKPRIYKGIVGSDDDVEQLKEQSFKLQKKLSDSKSSFATAILFELVCSADSHQTIPKYINDGLIWLTNELGVEGYQGE